MEILDFFFSTIAPGKNPQQNKQQQQQDIKNKGQQ